MKTVAWNVDTQYDFMRPDGRLYVQGAESIEGNLELITKTLRQSGIQIVNTADWHNPDSPELSDNPDYVNTFPEHCMVGTFGAEYVPTTKPDNPYVVDWNQPSVDLDEIIDSKEIVLYKDHFDVFSGNPYTNDILDALDPARAIVYGVATNVCVDYAVTGLLEKGIEVYVVEDAIKGLPGIDSPIEKWIENGAKLVSTNDIVDSYENGGK